MINKSKLNIKTIIMDRKNKNLFFCLECFYLFFFLVFFSKFNLKIKVKIMEQTNKNKKKEKKRTKKDKISLYHSCLQIF
jgi:hypothetical protein